jgi:hypothetical protein
VLLSQATLAAAVIAAVAPLVDLRAIVELHETYTRRLGRQFGRSPAPTSSQRSPRCSGC